MSQNPLFPQNTSPQDESQYALPGRQSSIQPLTNEEKASIAANPAADLIREKLNRIYAIEPNAQAEQREAEAARAPRTKHQQFMYELSTSGQSLADIQTAWHNYYVALPDHEKHEVWQEFYENNRPGPQPVLSEPTQPVAKHVVTSHRESDRTHRTEESARRSEKRSAAQIKHAIRRQVQKRTANVSTRTKHNVQSLMFGLATGFVVLVIFLFGFFNEVIIAPFIQPSRSSAAPVIVTTESVDASIPSIIIPKINVQIPTVFDAPGGDEASIQGALENGVVHYPSTKLPGQKGNAAFFGHSSNNIFNKGKYKFAFVLLHKLKNGDTFYLTYNNTVYGYKVISTKIVPPDQVDVLYDIPGQSATATLITCDPPGTSLNRLVVVGEQVSPDPAGNSKASPVDSGSSGELPGNGPTLWTRMWRSVF
jgi:sortase A